GTVDKNLKGQYVITYTATDKAGNIASEERLVNVVNSADLLAGAYIDAADNCNASGTSTFDATISTSNTQNGKFSIANFGAFGTSISVDLTYNKQNQTITAIGGQSLGGGAVLTAVTNGQLLSQSPVSFSIGYTWIDSGGATDFCTSTYTK
ncbi:MAG: immunoglobulin-like domain-containing protein, partial [Bacteroidota bacterium]